MVYEKFDLVITPSIKHPKIDFHQWFRMQISREDNVFKVLRITGPQHNFLCAEVVIGSESVDSIESLPLPPGESSELNPDAVLREIRLGFLDASRRLGIPLTAKRVKFLPSDSPPVEVYRSLADALATHFAQELP